MYKGGFSHARKPILSLWLPVWAAATGGLKQIDPVGPSGEAIIDYSLYDARRAGFETVVFIIKHEIEEPFKAAVVPALCRPGLRCAMPPAVGLPTEGFTVPDGRVKPWGTAHAILTATSRPSAAHRLRSSTPTSYYWPAGALSWCVRLPE